MDMKLLGAFGLGAAAGALARRVAGCLSGQDRDSGGASSRRARDGAPLPRAWTDKYPDRTRRTDEEQQRAFERMMRYDAETAYGMREAEA